MKQLLSEYIATEYSPDSMSDPRTVRKRIENGDIEDVGLIKEGGQWYVYLSSSTGNPIADSIIQEIECRG